MSPSGKNLVTRAGREAKRRELQRDWLAFLGDFPKVKAPLTTEILATEALPGFVRQRVKYQIEEGVFTEGYFAGGTDRGRRVPGP